MHHKTDFHFLRLCLIEKKKIWNNLIGLVSWHINLCGLFNAKAILQEEQ